MSGREAVVAGAHAVQLVSALLKRGPQVLATIRLLLGAAIAAELSSSLRCDGFRLG